MRTLITNDDGIDSPGLLRLAYSAVEAGLDVVVAAPESERSGSGAAITATESDGGILVERRHLEGLDGIDCFAVHAAPALIALVAGHGAFGDPPDLVLSGVNRGVNLGRVVLHSGTVGAAVTAGVNGKRGLAVSLDVGPKTPEPRWSVAARLAQELVPLLLDQPQGTVFNLNVPQCDSDRMPELRAATLASFGIVQTTMAERHDKRIRLSVADPSDPLEPGSDAQLLEEGFATVSSISSLHDLPMPPLPERGVSPHGAVAGAQHMR
ncbi:5'/3'-nucleotidase SurE [Okibacterium endophyticum]